MRSPFKFLDAYHLKDRAYFFGREKEVAFLYQMVTKNRLILVYGQSGTGKTSLVQCGLASRFDTTDWYPLYIKRGENINQVIRQTIAKALHEPDVESLPNGIEEIYANYLRPVYLIIDQMEELFILGTPEERKQFISSIKEILDANLPCRVIFILREEYLAQLYHFEKVIPSLLDRRLRVEPMSIVNLHEVITKSCQTFNITLEDPKQNTQRITDSLSAGKSGIHLPYLQVYLDMLWRENYTRTYGNNLISGEEYPMLDFTSQEIKNFGVIEDVLQRFLHQQVTEIQEQLAKEYPHLSPNAVRQVLDAFVTAEGTKRPLHYSLEGKRLIFRSAYLLQWNDIPDQALVEIFHALEQRRLLHSEGQSFELAHDSLAAIIDQERTDEQRQLAEIKRRLQNSYHEFTISGEYLTRKQIDHYEDFIPRLLLPTEILAFYHESRQHIQRKEKIIKIRRRLTYLGLFLFGLMMALAAVVSNNFREMADMERENAQNALIDLKSAQIKERALQIDRHMEKGESFMALGEYLKAITQFEIVLTFDSIHMQADSLRTVANQNSEFKEQFDQLMILGQQALTAKDLLSAMRYFNEANNMPLDATLRRDASTSIIETRSRMLPVFRKSVDDALTFKNAGYCDLALKDLQKSKALIKYLKKEDIQDQLKDINTTEKSCQENH